MVREASTKARTIAATSEALTSFVRLFRLECRPLHSSWNRRRPCACSGSGAGLPTAAPVPLGCAR
ncbi:hypothetical protein ACFWHW_11460 [Streptomyces pharetrae]|uniref:hypothetical protein n=1 Tax=Streptomyces pharetrae TaxID=291370 RepID=UPI003667086B